MQKLSLAVIQKRLRLAEEETKAKYATMKGTTSMPKSREADKPKDDFGKDFKKIKSNDSIPSDGKGAEDDGKSMKYRDGDAMTDTEKMDRGIGGKDGNRGEPSKPAVVKNKPNQATKLKQVTPQMDNTKKDTKNMPQNSKWAFDIVDEIGHGIGKNPSKADAGPSKPTWKKGDATTSPKAKEVKADMGRDPKKTVTSPTKPSMAGMPSDAPKKPTWQKVKAGVIVEVNNKIKAKFDLISESVLQHMVENYKSTGYKVRVLRTTDVVWKADEALIAAINEAIDARFNHVKTRASKARRAAFNRFYDLVKSNYNGLYESRGDFVDVVRTAFKRLEKVAEARYVEGLELFEGVVRVKTPEGKVEDFEIMTEATDKAMAARQILRKVAEETGLQADVRHLFIDGKRIDLKRIPKWTPKS